MAVATIEQKANNSRWLGVTFGFLFVAVASFVIYTLVALYSEGAQSKARAVASAPKMNTPASEWSVGPRGTPKLPVISKT